MSKKINLTVTITENKLADNKIDSFWYDGDIAYVNLLSGNRIYAEAIGEIRVNFEENSEQTFQGGEARQQATRLGFNDDDLDKINDHDGFGNTNWFNIIKTDMNGNVVSDDLALCHDYDEAIKTILVVAHQEHNEEYS